MLTKRLRVKSHAVTCPTANRFIEMMTPRIKTVLPLSLLFFSVSIGLAQTTDPRCVQTLRTARATYEQGRLHEMQSLLDDCLNNFSKNEKIEAYKLLVLTYIYLEEPQKADEAMLDLLRTDNFFKPSDVDPAEFRNLYAKFRTKPVLSIGVRGGVLSTRVHVQEHYHIFANSQGKGTYKSNVRFVGGLAFEKSILKDKIVLAPEFLLSGHSFTYTNTEAFSDDNTADNGSDPTGLEAIIQQSTFQFNLIGNYMFKKTLLRGLLQPYAGAGLATSYMTANSSKFLGELQLEPRGDDVSGAELDNTENFKSLNFAGVLLVGGKIKIATVYLTADLRYYYGLNNIVNPDNRYKMEGDNIEILTRYGYVNNDFKINQASISIGLIYPYFKPKKLIK